MTKHPIKNIAASVYDQLKNKAKETNSRFDEWLRFFAMERFLYRLSKSSHADQFVLKGALMFKVWKADLPRPTLDIDLLGKPDVVQRIGDIVRGVCLQRAIPNDGLVFDSDSVRTNPIAEHADFKGVRVSFQGKLINARIPMQIDIGFGTVSPGPVEVNLPTILDFPSPKLQGYTRESTVAEKFHAMVRLEILNSRMKDFFDIWLLSHQFKFDGRVLGQAIVETFNQRVSKIPEKPMALSDTFSGDSSKITQWKAFRTKQKLEQHCPESLCEVVDDIKVFLGPVIKNLVFDESFEGIWRPGGPWKKKS